MSDTLAKFQEIYMIADYSWCRIWKDRNDSNKLFEPIQRQRLCTEYSVISKSGSPVIPKLNAQEQMETIVRLEERLTLDDGYIIFSARHNEEWTGLITTDI